MDGELLTVQIRSPSMSETLTLTIQRDASIHSLKQQILSVHPKKPSVVDQRIIFSGKLLNDTDTLNRILEKTDVNSIPTFHLVVKPTPITAPTTNTMSSSSTSSTTNTSSYMNTRPSVPSPLSNVISPPNNAPSSQPQSSTTFASQQQQQTPFTQQSQQQGAMPGYPSLLPGGYQVIALNGQYYLAPVLVPAVTPQLQQQQQVPVQQHQNFYHPFQPQAQPQIHTGVNAQQQPQQPHLPHLAPQQQQGAGIRIHGRIQATSIWLALKLVFILFILCQDASLERILFFHVLAFVFFLYQTGRLRFVVQRVRLEDLNRPQQQQQPQPQQQQQQPPQQPQPQPPQQHVPVADNNNNGNNNNNNNNDSFPPAPTTPQPGNQNEQAGSSSGQQQQQQQGAQRQRPTTLLGTIKRGAYTFIASLWPNYGHDARIAQALDNGQNDWEGI